jgi:hypothetical protein
MRYRDGQLYASTVTSLEGVFDNHPDCFDGLSEEDQQVLSEFYFAGREIDVADIQAYRDELLREDPTILKRAQMALRNFHVLYKMPMTPGEYSEIDPS